MNEEESLDETQVRNNDIAHESEKSRKIAKFSQMRLASPRVIFSLVKKALQKGPVPLLLRVGVRIPSPFFGRAE